MAKKKKEALPIRTTRQISVSLNRGNERESKTTLITSAQILVGNVTITIDPLGMGVTQAFPPHAPYVRGGGQHVTFDFPKED